MTYVTLIRHGQTDWNLAGRVQGSTDIELNDTGRRQAREAAGELRIDGAVYLASSDLVRAGETAAIIGGVHGWGAPHVHPLLRERHYGEAEGLDMEQFAARFGPWHAAVVPGSETTEVIVDRALRALDELAAAARRSTAEGTAHVVAVSHGALITALLRRISKDTLPETGRVRNGEAFTFLVERERVRMVEAARN